MIKLADLLNEIDIPKNEWKPISKGELNLTQVCKLLINSGKILSSDMGYKGKII